MEKAPTNSLFVFLSKALSRIPSSLCSRQAAGSRSELFAVAQSDERRANQAWAYIREQ